MKFKRIFFDTHNLDCVILAGSGRSGTTWVEEIINHNNSYRMMFEPFHSDKVSLFSDWNNRQYIRPGTADPERRAAVERVLTGNIRDPWVDRFNRKRLSKKRLIKDIRANLFLKWLHRNFSSLPIFFLVRHPCAVVSSRKKIGWSDHLEDYLQQDELIQDHLSPFVEKIRSARTEYERSIHMWCIENYVPLKQFQPGEVQVLFYENICLNPGQALETVRRILNLEIKPEKFSNAVKSPSAVSHPDSAVVKEGNLVSEWRRELSAQEIEIAKKICELYGLDRIYGDGDTPILSGEDAIKLASD